jgi:hypothetical protein
VRGCEPRRPPDLPPRCCGPIIVARFVVAALCGCAVPTTLCCVRPPDAAPSLVPNALSASPSSSRAVSPATNRASYSRTDDPMYRSLEQETNVYGRQTVAVLWLAAARCEQPEGGPRTLAAREALDEASRDEQQDHRPCDGRAQEALGRARAAKDSFEQRYLALSATQGEEQLATRCLDAHVHCLRDEIDRLERLLRAWCPPSPFPQTPSNE